MSVWRSEEPLVKELSCPICLRLFTEPMMLPCGHNYCLACIQKVVDSEKGPHLCPECRQEYRGTGALQKNVKLCNIVSSYQATVKRTGNEGVPCDYCLENGTAAIKTCLNCEISLCSQHLHRHSIKYSFSNHTLMEPQSDLHWKMCSVHNKLLEFFCTTDRSFLCSTCFIEGSHQDHDIQNFESAGAEIRRVLQSQLKLASDKMKMIESLLQRSMEEEKVFTAACNKLEAKSMTLLGSILHQVNSYTFSLSKELAEVQRVQRESWQSDINHNMKQQATLKDVQEEVTSVLEETDMCLFLQRCLSINDQLKEATESNVTVLVPPVLDVKHLSTAVGTNDFREETTRLLQALHTLLNPLELTFNPNTAHPNLLMVRKGDGSRLGHNAVSWRLQWKNKKLTACHASHTVTLPDTLPPLRLEMALDYGAGTLCFYSSIGRKEHLHTFRTTFCETAQVARMVEEPLEGAPQVCPDTARLCAALEAKNAGLRAALGATQRGLRCVLNPSEVTLDPNTVHPSLLLSEDLTTVVHSATKQPYPQHPERFASFLQVLSSQGFSGGQHRWQVEAQECQWVLGVCYRSLARVGLASALESSSGSWCLMWCDNLLRAYSQGRDTPLLRTTALRKLDMHLNYEAGSLSFYSCNEGKVHLHTFKTTFTEPVYLALRMMSCKLKSRITLKS
ncbi:E3 ubiquitin/ISG15 ligase TRIM25-like [Arapaima gigas]